MQLQTENKYLHVPSRLDIKVEVDRLFVTLTLEHQGTELREYSHKDLLKAGNRLRIIGDPGSGKSSLVKRVFRDTCRAGIAKPSKTALPILFELKNLRIPTGLKDKGLGDWFYGVLREATQATAVYKMGERFDSYAENSGLLVLLDGLDEVSSHDYTRVQLAINALSEKLSRLSASNAVVLTIRTQFYQQIKEAFRNTFGQALFIKPFSPSNIYEFLFQWYSAESRTDRVTAIYKELTDRPTLREMCTNPLVLAMYVADRQSGSDVAVPDSRTEFYRRVTEELLIKRRLRQTGSTPASTKVREQRERILGRLAYDHLLDPSQPANSLKWFDGMNVVKTVMRCTDAKAQTVFQEIAKETGLVTEERQFESFRFIHLTFCEFLAAYEAVEGQKDWWEELVAAHKQSAKEPQPHASSRLLEVIPFACGLMPRVRRAEVVSEVAALRDHRLLARSFMETKSYEQEAWLEFVELTRSALLNTPEKEWDEQWLRDLHLFNVVVLDANQCSAYVSGGERSIDLGEFFRVLVAKQKNSLLTLLSAYAAQDAAAAFRLAEVCGLDLATQFPEIVISNCDQSPFFALVVKQALDEPRRADLWSTILGEAGLRSRLVADRWTICQATKHWTER